MSQRIESQADFQRLAEIRLMESELLLANGQWDGAFYLAGYVVELALKFCIIKRQMANDRFPQKDYSKDCYSHNLAQLARIAELSVEIESEASVNAIFSGHWHTVCQWSEQKRYDQIGQQEAIELLTAINDSANGVFPWIKSHW